ncbi:substrate-binding periplasmic protein [Paucibacter soli]|uniref:substrate-binding periplasmic protein n=1 Tax=Paucibacter soli TaxID=3133433 RepID=UPI0030A4EDBC
MPNLLCSWLVAAVLGAAACAPVLARELLVVGTHFPRLFMQEAGAPVQGLGVDILSLAAARAGHSLRFELLPWARAQAMVQAGQADILVGPYRTPERELKFAFSQLAFYEDALVFYARRSQPPLWHGDFAELRNHSIGLVHGWAYGEAFDQARPGLRLSTALDVESGLKMLLLGRIDLLASNERNTRPVLEAQGWVDLLVRVGPQLGQLRGHFAYPHTPEGEALRDQLDRHLANLRSAGALRELGERWGVKIPD